MSGTPRMIFYRSSLNPDQSRMGSLEIRVTYKLSTAALGSRTIFLSEDYTAQPICFVPMRDLASIYNASLFFSTAVAGYLGLDQESIVPITFPMVLEAVRVYVNGGQSCGVQIYVEFEVVIEPTRFLDGGSLGPDALVIDSLPVEEDASGDGTISNDANRGMIAPEISQSEKVTQSWGGGTCSICQDDFSAGDLIKLLSPCSHSFHAKCIAIWLRRNRTCPMC